MKKEDFHKGQKVWVYLIGDAARGKESIEERIQEWKVVSVGRKYITARPKGRTGAYFNEKFEIENDFQHVYTYGSANYILYLSKEDIFQGFLKVGDKRIYQALRQMGKSNCSYDV